MSKFRQKQDSQRLRLVRKLVTVLLAENGSAMCEADLDHALYSLIENKFPDTNPASVDRELEGIRSKLSTGGATEDTLALFDASITDIRATEKPGNLSDESSTFDIIRFLLLISGQPLKVSRRVVKYLWSERAEDFENICIEREEKYKEHQELIEAVRSETVETEDTDCLSSDSEPEILIITPDMSEPVSPRVICSTQICESKSTVRLNRTGRIIPQSHDELVDIIADRKLSTKQIGGESKRQFCYESLFTTRFKVSDFIVSKKSYQLIMVTETWLVWDVCHMLLGYSTTLVAANRQVELRLLESSSLGCYHLSPAAVWSMLTEFVNLANQHERSDLLCSILTQYIESSNLPTLTQLLCLVRKEVRKQINLKTDSIILEYKSFVRGGFSDYSRELRDRVKAEKLKLLNSVAEDVGTERFNDERDSLITRLKYVYTNRLGSIHKENLSNRLKHLSMGGESDPYSVRRRTMLASLKSITIEAERALAKIVWNDLRISEYFESIRIICFFEKGGISENLLESLQANGMNREVANKFVLKKIGLTNHFSIETKDVLSEIFSADSIIKYSKIFGILNNLRVLSNQLKQFFWKFKLFKSLRNERITRILYALRFEMYHFISAIDQYFRLTVILASIKDFKASSSNISSVSDIIALNTKLAQSVSIGCFFNTESSIVLEALLSVLNECGKYEELIMRTQNQTRVSDNSIDSTESHILIDSEIFTQLTESAELLAKNFKRKRNQFVSLLNAQSIVYGSQAHAAKLLVHLKRLS